MSKKEKFINCIQEEIFNRPDIYGENWEDDWEDICDFWETFKNSTQGKETPKITENGIKILTFMQENETQYNNIFKSKDIAEGLFVSSRSISGAMQKLIKEGYCEKLGGSPVCYSLTDIGRNEAVSA